MSSWWAPAVALLLSGAATFTAAQAVPQVQIDPKTGLFVDIHGRVRIFHGVNVVYKVAPWYPPSANFTVNDSLDAHTMDLMRKWGFNVVRLGVMWNGVETKKGTIDQSYLTEVARLSSEMSKRGVYTLVDLHQDVGSREFCGEGFPEFYIDELAADPKSALSTAAHFPRPQRQELARDASGVPLMSECLKTAFAKYYLTDKVGAMWQSLYTPGSELNTGFTRYWAAVAKTFVNASHVVGYELLNEPSGYCLGGSTFSCLDAAAPVFGDSVEKNSLMPLYQAAAKKIRTIDTKTPIFYEPTIVPKIGVGPFPSPALGDDPQQGLAYHIYCQPGDGDGWLPDIECKAGQELYTHLYYSFLKEYKVGGFLTEFGAIGGNPKELDHLDRLLGFSDDMWQSWTYWQLKLYEDFTTANAAESLYDGHGNLNIPKLKTLSRTYAQAIAGTPKKMSYDPHTGAFTLQFTATLTDVPTEIYLNEELNYPSGHAVAMTPGNCLAQQKPEPNYIHFLLQDPKCKGKDVTIWITRAQSDDAISLIV